MSLLICFNDHTFVEEMIQKGKILS